MVLALLPSLSSSFRSRSVPRMPPSFTSLAFSLRGEGRLLCCSVRVSGELSSCRMASGDLPSTLPFGFCLLCLEPEDQGVSGSLKGLPEPRLALTVSVSCPVSSLENTCLEGKLKMVSGSKMLPGPQGITVAHGQFQFRWRCLWRQSRLWGRIQFGGFSLK